MGIKIEKVDKSQYKLIEGFFVSSLGYTITVKEGLIFDGASIPKVFWTIIGSPFTGLYTKSATVHDALYMSEMLPRSICDDIFLDLMKQAGVGYFKRYTMYWAVRGFGWSVWSKHKPEEVKFNKGFIDVV